MAKKLFLILGNGFSIDLLNHINKRDTIDVVNLFRYGADVTWPCNDIAGFLSYRHCPNLWNLGARPNMSPEEAMDLVERVITCANVFALRKKTVSRSIENKTNKIYVDAYHELALYLRALFTFYNSKVEKIIDDTFDWPWAKFIEHANNSQEYSEINIVTYNYDIWLERILNELNIPFSVPGLKSGETKNAKINIFKPHGSISFYHKTQQESDYCIPYDRDIFPDASTNHFILKHEIEISRCLVNAMIPPAGDSTRMANTWSGQISQNVISEALQLTSNDELMICGISYWHVDRAELDSILVNVDPLVNVYMFNPTPNKSLNAVLTSMFSNYVYHTSSSSLKGRYK
ncbi:TPA: SIR2 family protein [Photobacterium damselae]|uniref:SIR2 family protein n=1 Tax=Photobacterium damselae TaxID=38293 RepID=UPI0025434399|nr:SIR2 family protein [Photobacterium damselae]WIH21453.1 SIR2 family protein [Photobacterium damselae]